MAVQPRRAAVKKPEEPLLLLGLFLFGLLLIVFVVFSFPAGLLFLTCLLAWLWARRRKQPWTAVLASVALPLTIGFGIDSVVAILLRIFQPQGYAHHWRVGEEVLIFLRINVHDIAEIGLWKLAIVTIVLLVLNYLSPRQKVVTRFLFLQRAFSFLFLVLAAVTTFTIFADKPLQKAGEDDRQDSESRVHEAFRRQYNAVGRDLAVEAVKTAASNISSADKRHLIAFEKKLDSMISGTDGTVLVKQFLVDTMQKTYNPGIVTNLKVFLSGVVFDTKRVEAEASPLPIEQTVDHVAGTLDEWRRQRALVEGEELKADVAEGRASDNLAALKALLSGIFAAPLPDFNGLAGAVIENLSGAVTDRLADTTIDWLSYGSPSDWVRQKIGILNLESRVQRLASKSTDTVRHFLIPEQWDGYSWNSRSAPSSLQETDDYLPRKVLEDLRNSLPDAKNLIDAIKERDRAEATGRVSALKDILEREIRSREGEMDAER